MVIGLFFECACLACTVIYLGQSAYKLYWYRAAKRQLALAQRTVELINADRRRTRAGVYNVRR